VAAERASPLRVLGDRNFWPYFAGNLASNCGTWFQNIAQAILVYRLTRSTLLVGVVNFAQFVGTFVLAPWAGSAADRYDRRRLLVLTQIGAAAVTCTLAVLQGVGLATAPVVIGLALVLGMSTAFAIPALQALVPDLVPDRELAAAVALSSLTFNLARAIGPVAGALVVARLGVAPAFALNSLSFLGLIAGLLAVRPRPAAWRGGGGNAGRPRLSESIRIVRDDACLVALLVTVAAISISQDPVTTLTPGFSAEVFHRADTLTGLLVGAFGAGSVLAAVSLAGRGLVRRLPGTCLVMGAGISAFGLARTLPFAFASLVVAGFAFLLTNTAATTAMQLEVAPSQRGRVMALWSLCFLGTRPLASLVDGVLASVVGLRAAALALAVPVVAVGLVLGLRRERLLPAPAVAPRDTPPGDAAYNA
jgi:MFS family permease